MANDDKVGVAWPTDSVAVIVEVLYLPVSLGVSVAVIVDDPAPTTVTVEPEIVATDVFDET